MTAYVPAPQESTAPPRLPDLLAMMLADALRESIYMGAATAPRSLQVTAGASEIGGNCPAQQSFRAHHVPAVNFPDPLRRLVGTGVHLALGEIFSRLDMGSGAYGVEIPVTYRGIPGKLDLFIRRRATIVDFKTTTKAKIKQLQREGPPRPYVVQLNIYAAGLIEAGEQVRTVALCYVPLDGELSDIWVWTAPPDRALADDAISSFLVNAQTKPEDAPRVPSRLCGWCAHYQPGSTDKASSCPGQTDVQVEGE